MEVILHLKLLETDHFRQQLGHEFATNIQSTYTLCHQNAVENRVDMGSGVRAVHDESDFASTNALMADFSIARYKLVSNKLEDKTYCPRYTALNP
jgi:hypothetical protein